MKVSGFSIIRNGMLYGYPFKEAVLSVLPLCDEFIINVGRSDDNTLDVIKSINSPKLKILETEWDMTQREGGKLLSIETNRALRECTGDWGIYIQGDEVLHEKYIPAVKEAMAKYYNAAEIEGLRFRYKHFYGSYDYYQDNFRKWYTKEVRVIRNNGKIVSWGDAMDFKHHDGSKINAADIDAEIYHYGWVRPPDTLIKKRIDFEKFYKSDEEVSKVIRQIHNYDDLGNLKRFTDTHPEVMKERINSSSWDFDAKLEEQSPEWLRKFKIWLHPVSKRIKKLFNAGK
jgi:hypothetical protein